jgi:hypothetical protein
VGKRFRFVVSILACRWRARIASGRSKCLWHRASFRPRPRHQPGWLGSSPQALSGRSLGARLLARPQPSLLETETAPDPEPPRQLTREEREQLRRRFRIAVAALAGVVLLAALWLLLQLE